MLVKYAKTIKTTKALRMTKKVILFVGATVAKRYSVVKKLSGIIKLMVPKRGLGHRYSPAGEFVDPASAPVAPPAFKSYLLFNLGAEERT